MLIKDQFTSWLWEPVEWARWPIVPVMKLRSYEFLIDHPDEYCLCYDTSPHSSGPSPIAVGTREEMELLLPYATKASGKTGGIFDVRATLAAIRTRRGRAFDSQAPPRGKLIVIVRRIPPRW